jgi:hypothetical protein
MAIAISFTKGEVMRKESEIPSGILTCIIPTNKGMEEHEQKGVKAPKVETPDIVYHLRRAKVSIAGR